MMDEFIGMTAEEIYPYVLENEDETLDRHLYDDAQGDDSDTGERGGRSEPNETQHGTGPRPEAEPGQQKAPPPLTAGEREALHVQWQQRLAGAAQQARQAGKLSGAMARLVDFLLQPQLPWRMLLARYMSAVARDDYSYTRPSARRGAPAIFPSLRSNQVDIAVALDTSGSISAQEIREFLAEIDAIKSQVRARITVHTCDTQLAADGPWQFEAWEPCELPARLRGGGGTRFTPVFEWLGRQDRAPELLVYFTDARGEFPAQAPHYPVIWLVKGKSPVPWGQRVQLN